MAYLLRLWTPVSVDVILAVVVVKKLMCLWAKGVREDAGSWADLTCEKAVVASLVDLV